jgi:retinol-binding protein 3
MRDELRRAGRSLAWLATAMVVAWPGRGFAQKAGLDAAFVRDTVTSLGRIVDREYFDPQVARRAADALNLALGEGRYDAARDVDDLARRLTGDLLAASHDKHLAVGVVRNAGAAASGPAPDTARAERGRRSNYGVERVEIFPGNVGLLRVTSFYRPNEAGSAIGAAMEVVRNADALILDLRGNGGGSPDTVTLVASHCFDQAGLKLFDIVDRAGSSRAYATLAPAPPARNGHRPMYVLTDAGTFSAGEGLAFLLQERRRAEVVGETTAGAANPGRPFPINDRLEVTVPTGQVRAAVTGRNWEGTGVVPDIRVPAADALRAARVRALGTLISQAPPGPWRDTLSREMAALERQGPG